MATATELPQSSAAESTAGSARRSSIVILLRLEGLAVAAITALLYARAGASWWLLAALWLAPDVSMLGYLAGACRGARVYNAFHSYLLPALLALAAILLHLRGFLPVALIWANHIGIDRALGYGLKYGDGFGYTHLGRVGHKKN